MSVKQEQARSAAKAISLSSLAPANAVESTSPSTTESTLPSDIPVIEPHTMKVSITSLTVLSLGVSQVAFAYDGWCNAAKQVTGEDGYRMTYPYYKSGPKASFDCIMKDGSKGDGVHAMQVSLNICHGGGIAEDGKYGPKTKAAVEKAQKEVHVKVDGSWGPVTGAAMNWDASKADPSGHIYAYGCKHAYV